MGTLERCLAIAMCCVYTCLDLASDLCRASCVTYYKGYHPAVVVIFLQVTYE